VRTRKRETLAHYWVSGDTKRLQFRASVDILYHWADTCPSGLEEVLPYLSDDGDGSDVHFGGHGHVAPTLKLQDFVCELADIDGAVSRKVRDVGLDDPLS